MIRVMITALTGLEDTKGGGGVRCDDEEHSDAPATTTGAGASAAETTGAAVDGAATVQSPEDGVIVVSRFCISRESAVQRVRDNGQRFFRGIWVAVQESRGSKSTTTANNFDRLK